ncbi:MAG: type II toxin-antitoxin system VapC family toxin [Candidatus Rokubacteria bacterium]|nr:type II toxin-antitoxin system VapC family toxin [Candidatus Rokubacteria bacterium]
MVVLELRLGAETLRRRRAVDGILAAFPPERVLAPTPRLFNRAGQLFHSLYQGGRGLADRLGPIDDLLIALTAWQIGATLVTANLAEFHRIAASLPGLSVAAPGPAA